MKLKEQNWLKNQVYKQNTLIMGIVRRAIHFYHQQIDPTGEGNILDLPNHTQGIWRNGDATNYIAQHYQETAISVITRSELLARLPQKKLLSHPAT